MATTTAISIIQVKVSHSFRAPRPNFLAPILFTLVLLL